MAPTLLMAQGRFVRERVSGAFAQRGRQSKSASYRGADFFVRGEDALAFLGQRTILSGMAVAVRAALDCNFGLARAIDSESWLQHLRAALASAKGPASPVGSLYVRLQPATREELMRETGEGGTMEEFAGRLDLDSRSERDHRRRHCARRASTRFGGRLGERIREARVRPIVAAFGFGRVYRLRAFLGEETTSRATLTCRIETGTRFPTACPSSLKPSRNCATKAPARRRKAHDADVRESCRIGRSPALRGVCACPGTSPFPIGRCSFRRTVPWPGRNQAGWVRAATTPRPRAPSCAWGFRKVEGAAAQREGVGLPGLREAATALDCGNSGTTMRLFCGLARGPSV